MKDTTRKITLFLLLVIGTMPLQAQTQSAILSSGGNGAGTTGSASYAIGQVFHGTHTGSGGTVMEGIQQAFEISVITGTSEGADVTIAAYPNPAHHQLIVKANDAGTSALTLQVYNASGVLLQSHPLLAEETEVDVTNLPPAIYFFKIVKGANEVKTFKIIKK